MIGDEPDWLVNLIITISVLPLIVGSVGEHAGTETLLIVIAGLFFLVGMYTLFSGQIVDPPRPEVTNEGAVPQRSNPFAVHSDRGSPSESSDEGEEDADAPDQ